MYSYTYDKETGGFLLNTTPTGFSKEPRPVYALELDLLGFDKHWLYEKQDHTPYMWAEANVYIYKGVPVAKLKGGNIFTAPEIVILNDENGNPISPEPLGHPLQKIDIQSMIEKNREIMQIIENTTVKKIVNIYEKYKNKLDCFHVAFSGGKDSCVLLDLVKKALPEKEFMVVFGDTGMEYPDTYDLIEKVKQDCLNENILFYTAKSHLSPKESWKMFGPPSRVLKWCCSVHKTAPQTLKLREITGINNVKCLDFVGVRASESINRSRYKYENYGQKQKGQYSYNPILEWSSAEIWLFIYLNNILINKTYKKGNSRAGCVCCPMSGDFSNSLRHLNYASVVDKYIDYISNAYDNNNSQKIFSYITNGGWNARKNGRDLSIGTYRFIEQNIQGKIIFTITYPKSDWKEWMKTIGDIRQEDNQIAIEYENQAIFFSIDITLTGYNIALSDTYIKNNPTFGKLIRQVFRKAAYCEGCKVCQSNCSRGCIDFIKDKIQINNCIKCHDCHSIDSGCLLYHSLRHSQVGGKTMKSLNSFADHAPKVEWLHSFFTLKEAFFTDHTLGPVMFDMFRRFLKDASLNDKNHFTAFAEMIFNLGWENDVAQGLILINLTSENPQILWYITNFELGFVYTRKTVEQMLISREVKPKDAKSIVKAYKRLTETPLGTALNFGHVTDSGDIVRTKCRVTDSRVILYGLYKFAEKCGDYRDFTLSVLLNDSIERDGVSPTRIFGLDREEMVPILMGLSQKYPEFINASFSADLEKIVLASDKSSLDVLGLFEGDWGSL